MSAGDYGKRPSADAAIFRDITMVVDEENGAGKHSDHQSRFGSNGAETPGRKPVGAAYRPHSEESDHDEFAERCVGDRPRSASVSPADADRCESEQQNRPAA